MKKITLLLLIALLPFITVAQKKVQPTPEDIDLAEKLKEKYPDEEVAFKSIKDHITFGFDKKNEKVLVFQTTEEHLINIAERADIQKYCMYDTESEVKEFSFKYRNGKGAFFRVRDEAYTSQDLFHNDTRVKYTNMDFPLKGYTYYVTLEKKYKDIKYFTKLYFNDDYPAMHREIIIEVPDWLDIELREVNFENYTIKKSTQKNEKNTQYTYTVEDIHARYNESRSPGPTYLYPHILILPKAYTYNDTKGVVFNSTQDLYNWYHTLTSSLTNDRTAFKDKVAKLTESVESDKDKIRNIYYWVQDNIRYIAFEDGIAGFKPDEAGNVFQKRYGDCKGMANLTKQMLIEAGFDARLTWIGTKHIAYDYSTPCLSVDNHMICALLHGGDTLFLDATEKFNAFGEYADRIQGKQVLIEEGKNFMLKTVPVSKAEKNKEIVYYTYTIEDELLKGTAKRIYKGEQRTSILHSLHTMESDKKDEQVKKFLENNNANIKVSNIQSSELSDREADLEFSYDIEVRNAVSSFDNDVYVAIDIDKELGGFELKERETSYLFTYKKCLESIIEFKIPEGYKVTHIPENITFSHEDFDLSVDFTQAENTIRCKKYFVIHNAKIQKKDFETWNSHVAALKAVYNDQIIISKI